MLKNIHAGIIDVRYSEYDKEKSNPKKGKYVWKKKALYRDSLKDKSRLPEYWISWGRLTEDGYDLIDWKTNLQFDFVKLDDDYVPDMPDGVGIQDGHWVYKDAVMMKCPMRVYLERMKRSSDKSLAARDAKRREFRHTANAQAGESVVLTDDEFERLRGVTPK